MKLRTKLIVAFMSVMILPMIFLNVVMHTFASREVGELQQLYMIVVFITTTLLIYWIYRSVSVPLAKLQKAARNIKEGNLDFEIRQESDDEIGQLCQDFEEMRLRLKANAEEKVAFDRENKELISNISHDLKTPITAIKGYVEGIMETLLIVLVACQLDAVIGGSFVRDAAIIGFSANEAISIVENAGLMGLPIPAAITKAIDILKQRAETPEKGKN